MDFIVEKDPGLIPQVLSKILDSCVNGVTLADPDQEDMPLVYVNKAFETITGYTLAETVGRNCRFLQGDEHDQAGVKQLKEGIKNRKPVEVVLRNFRKNGELFYNHLLVSPLFDSHGNLLYFLGVQLDITPKIRAEEEIKALKEQLAALKR
ncbi:MULTISPECIES: PAS domain-containing protein [Nitrosomonas]|uniref:PAS domain S-box-containing protein n=2 Tax=Nitrosomonas TaxID=914 RepID=A0A1H8KJY1_9PROT|nr:PAS domain-containing protein [Nitrosomonas oligotropha]PTQ76902.1 PAS domain S-box-containing protein [Nitrosomonas oligotropha]TXI29739.1 MAG: PAS domain-containing protein [Nitrosomonas oligotropha]SDW32557.1 PAS domain S-box-containing protein [Nitrosomonas oligotropha]SEN93194.1 PAS domain S-box-containing protein [Nitrosomonas oligotropha]